MGSNNTGDRGVSTVLGVALVLGMVIVASAVILGVGAITLHEMESTVSTESAVTQMQELNARLLEVAGKSDAKASMEMEVPDSGSLNVESSGW